MTVLCTLLLSFCWLFVSFNVANAELLSWISFEKPFDTINADGVRQVGDQWEFGGSTTVNRHFVRLTPYRQHKKGFIWSKDNLKGKKEFSLVLTFRISGQGENWFGDGIGLWITTSNKYVEGDNHGFSGNFKGFGIIFDTFVNQEHRGHHKDVTLFENDGTKNLDTLLNGEKLGCLEPKLRYHEKNPAFSASLNMSRAKIQYKSHYILISIDPGNTGEWITCYSAETNLKDESWLENAHIGVTSSTGSLADNHDIISLNVYDDVIDISHEAVDEKVKNASVHDLNESLVLGTNEEKLRLLKRKYEKLVEDFEHQLTALKEKMDNTIEKIAKEEQKDTEHINELEKWAFGAVSEEVEYSVKEMQDEMHAAVQKKIKETAKNTTGWKTPFAILLLLIAAAVGFVYKKYQDLRKSHLL